MFCVDLILLQFAQVVIEGFKSYREQVATDPFSPKVNCVGTDFLSFFGFCCFERSLVIIQLASYI